MHEPPEILPVEDNPHDAELTLHALKQHKLANRIHVVRDGAETLDNLFADGKYAGRGRLAAPRVVMLDLKLPKVDGLEVLKRLKENPNTRRIPVVMLSSSREEREVVASYGSGANSYITKPLDFEQFTEAIEQLGLYRPLNEPPV